MADPLGTSGDVCCAPVVESGLRRVLDLPAALPVRGDTPLTLLGVDSLALVCLGDVIVETGCGFDEALATQAVTVDDLVALCRPGECCP